MSYKVNMRNLLESNTSIALDTPEASKVFAVTNEQLRQHYKDSISDDPHDPNKISLESKLDAQWHLEWE